jgi:hypothetical protein
MKYQYFNQENPFTKETTQFGQRSNDDGSFTSFLFDPANTDYQQFKIQVADGTPLEDPNGVIMTQAEVDAFLLTIP